MPQYDGRYVKIKQMFVGHVWVHVCARLMQVRTTGRWRVCGTSVVAVSTACLSATTSWLVTPIEPHTSALPMTLLLPVLVLVGRSRRRRVYVAAPATCHWCLHSTTTTAAQQQQEQDRPASVHHWWDPQPPAPPNTNEMQYGLQPVHSQADDAVWPSLFWPLLYLWSAESQVPNTTANEAASCVNFIKLLNIAFLCLCSSSRCGWKYVCRVVHPSVRMCGARAEAFSYWLAVIVNFQLCPHSVNFWWDWECLCKIF